MPEPEVLAPSDQSGAAPAPEVQQGQADGSPPAGENPTSGGNENQEPDVVKELRRALTRKGEEASQNAKAKEILDRVMQEPEFAAIEARITGQPAPAEKDVDEEVFGTDNLPIGKKFRESVIAEAERRILGKVAPTLRKVHSAEARGSLERAVKAANLPPDTVDSESFQTFEKDFEDETDGYSDFRRKNPGAANKWLVTEFVRSQTRGARQPVGDRVEAALDRGGGASRAGSAASQVKIAHSDPHKIDKLHDAISKGDTPVDENGVPYKVRRPK